MVEKMVEKSRFIEIYCDGGYVNLEGNGIGASAVIYGSGFGKEEQIYKKILNCKNNMQAEFEAIFIAVVKVFENFKKNKQLLFKIFTDCQGLWSCVIRRKFMKGICKESMQKLFEILDEIGESILIEWIERKKNKIADKLCRKVLSTEVYRFFHKKPEYVVTNRKCS
jgi:ribonuclease HI